MLWGIDFKNFPVGTAKLASQKCFERGLIIELAGRDDCVLKIMPPLTIEDDYLTKGLDVIKESIIELGLE